MEAARMRPGGMALLAGACLACLVVLRLALGRNGLLLDSGIAIVAGVSMLKASRRARVARSRSAWRIQVGFAFVWAAAPLVSLAGGSALVFDSIRAVAILLAACGWWYTSHAADPWSRVRLIIDGGLAAGSAFIVGWVPVFHEVWSAQASAVDGVIDLFVPLATVAVAVFVSGVALTEMRVGHRLMPAHFVIGLLVIGWSDATWTRGDTPLWAVGWALVALGTLLYRGTSGRLEVVSTHQRFAFLPYLLLGPAAVALAFDGVNGGIPAPSITVALVMVGLLLVRQHVTLIENSGLVKRLAVTEEMLRHQATHDNLTGLAGRALLRARLDDVASGSGAMPFAAAVIFVDLDGFKAVNDAHGHAAGDHVLVETARRLTRILDPLGDDALAARLSGDEFAILLLHDAASHAADTAHRILASIQSPITIDGTELRVGGSLGVASTRSDTMVPSALLRAADEAMYCVKHRGKGGVLVVRAQQSAGDPRP